MDSFLRLGGPSILRFRLDSMDGLVQCLIKPASSHFRDNPSVHLYHHADALGAVPDTSRSRTTDTLRVPRPCRRLDGGAEKRSYTNA